LGDGEAERLGGLEVDDQLERHRLLHRQIGRLGAFEDLPDIAADLAINSGEARSVADQPAGSHDAAPFVDRRNGIAGSQRHELLAPCIKERICLNDERACFQLRKGGEGRVDLAFVAGPEDFDQHGLYRRASRRLRARPADCSGLPEGPLRAAAGPVRK
jgi:hypothetical protein